MLNPFHLFLVVALVVSIAAVGYITVTDCAQAELVTLAGTVVGKTVGTREVERTVVSGGCPVCPGSKPKTEVVTVEEEVYYLLVEVEENGQPETMRFMVTEEVYRKTEIGTKAEVQLYRGAVRKTLCAPTELVLRGS